MVVYNMCAMVDENALRANEGKQVCIEHKFKNALNISILQTPSRQDS